MPIWEAGETEQLRLTAHHEAGQLRFGRGAESSDLLRVSGGSTVNRQRQPDLVQELPIRDRAAVLPQQPLDDLGFVGCIPITECSNHRVDIHAISLGGRSAYRCEQLGELRALIRCQRWRFVHHPLYVVAHPATLIAPTTGFMACHAQIVKRPSWTVHMIAVSQPSRRARIPNRD